MSKKIQSRIKLQIPSGMANPGPPIGPSLGQYGVNIIEFCKSFNSKTEKFEKGVITPVIINVYFDKSFDFTIKTPPSSILIKKMLGIKSGSNNPKKNKIGKININQIYKIAEIKKIDMTGSDIDAISRSIIGTAISMGLEIEE